MTENRRQMTDVRKQKVACLWSSVIHPLSSDLCLLTSDLCPLYLLPRDLRRLAFGQAEIFCLWVAQHHRVKVGMVFGQTDGFL
jgi:Na+-translocating ferredoxin:NAD+ oxidoreductase RnfC subunit